VSEFAGVIRFDGAPVDSADVERVRAHLHGFGPVRVWRPSPCVVLAERRSHAAHDNGSSVPPQQRHPDSFLLATVRLDAPDEVRASLGVAYTDDRALIAEAVARWGVEAAAERLHGDFAIAEWREDQRKLTIARCALGARSVYYVERPWGVIFGTALQNILPLPDVPRDLDEEMLAHIATLGFQDWDRTLYRHIRRAPVGGTISFERGRTEVRHYYTIDRIKPVRFARDNDYIDAARTLLDKVVARRMSPDGVLATHLSGGLDSAGVTATLARLARDRPVHAFTRAPGLDHPYDMDERALAATLVARYPNIRWTVIDGVNAHHRDIEPEAEAGLLCAPRRSSFNTSWFEPMRAAIIASGAEQVFSGGAGNSTLSYPGAPDFAGNLRSGRWIKAARDLRARARELRKPAFRIAARAAYDGLVPRSLKRWHARRTEGSHPWASYSLASPKFLDELSYDALSTSLGHDLPFQPLYSAQALRLKMLQAQSGRDLSSGLRRSGPPLAQNNVLGDREMVEFTLGIPQSLYWREGVSRWLARQTLADRVPTEILTSRKPGKQSPEWYALATRRHAGMVEAVERIGRSKLASRVLDIPRMHALLDTWPEDATAAMRHEALYGHGLQRAIALGGFLRWHEGGNE
jgi:asparagine synthase (glutamine-hydrolysing)